MTAPPPQPPPFADDATLSEVAAYWSSRRRGRLIPRRDDIDPLDLSPAIWPNLLLTEPAGDGQSWRYRLVGTAHVERYTFDFTGRTTADIMQGSYRTYMEAIYATAVREAAPVYSESVFRWDARGYAATRRLMLPLGRDSDSPDLVFSAQVWPTALPHQPRSMSELSGSGGFRDGFFLLLDRDTFRPLPR